MWKKSTLLLSTVGAICGLAFALVANGKPIRKAFDKWVEVGQWYDKLHKDGTYNKNPKLFDDIRDKETLEVVKTYKSDLLLPLGAGTGIGTSAGLGAGAVARLLARRQEEKENGKKR